MDIDNSEIEQRLAGHLKGTQRLVFWEDPAGDYADAVPALAVDGAVVLDITGAELASKRRILRSEPQQRFVIYRRGETPNAEDDLVYDLKCAASPFVCSMEGIWADECGIAPDKASVLADHAAFFRSKERREILSASTLPKASDGDIRFAMTAAALRVKEGSRRDAVRGMVARLLTEWSRGDSSSVGRISESGLSAVLWQVIGDEIGYKVPEGALPSVEDLAFRMLEAKCSSLIDDEFMANPAESTRILDALANSSATRQTYEHIAAECGPAVCALVPVESRSVECLSGCDAVREFDEWILMALVRNASTGSLDLAKVESIWARRQHMIWAESYRDRYEAVIAAGRFSGELKCYWAEAPSATTLASIFDRYCGGWCLVDTRYREFFMRYRGMRAGRFKEALAEVAAGISHDYGRFLVDLTDRWQLHLMDDGQWPPASIPSQDSFFHDYVELSFPRADNDKRIGVIISDALRYEAGSELAQRIGSSRRQGLFGKVKTGCDALTCLLPSYTQLGMAALLPQGPMEIDPDTMTVTKSGSSTLGKDNRQNAYRAKIESTTVFKAAELAESSKVDLSDSALAVVYHNVIDKTGDSRDTETKVFSAVNDAFDEIEELVAILLRSGCAKVLITADHGFLYQDENVEEYLYADVQNLSLSKSSEDIVCDHTRRFVVGNPLPKSDMLIEYAAIDLSLEGDYQVAMPKGITRLRLRGSGSRYVHGGASLQENAIPVVTVESVSTGRAVRPTAVEGFPIGRNVITGSLVSINVYQCEPCGDGVSPLTVRVGVYGKDGKLVSANEQTLKLESDSESAEARKTRVDLALTDDVDSYSSVVVRISAQVGTTSAFTPAWETGYSVVRAFGSDF